MPISVRLWVNVRWSWSARTPDDKTVVISFWCDRYCRKTTPNEYSDLTHPDPQVWINRRGNRERLTNLIWARDHCDGLFRVVMVRAKDPTAEPRAIADCFPKEDLIMRITDLNEVTGQFRAVAVEHDRTQI